MDLWNIQHKSSGQIGEILCKTPKAVISKIKRLRRTGVKMERQREKATLNEDEKERKCLRCRKDFLSKSRFNKICPKCTEGNAGIHDRAIMGFRS